MSKVKVSAGLVAPEASLLGLRMALFSTCPQSLPLCKGIPGMSHRVQLSSSFKDTSQVGVRATLKASFTLSHHFKGPVPKYSHILR